MHFLQVALFENKVLKMLRNLSFVVQFAYMFAPYQTRERNRATKCFLASLEPTLRNLLAIMQLLGNLEQVVESSTWHSSSREHAKEKTKREKVF